MQPDDIEVKHTCGCALFLGVMLFLLPSQPVVVSCIVGALVLVALIWGLVFGVRIAKEGSRAAELGKDADAARRDLGLTTAGTSDEEGAVQQDAEVTPDWMERLYEGKTCGICRNPFEPGGPFVECPDCRQWYHEDCWQQLGGCVTEGCPSAPSKAARRPGVRVPTTAQPVAVARAVHNVGFCPYCQTAVATGSEFVRCPGCDTPYHRDCWEENNGCAVRGCGVRTTA